MAGQGKQMPCLSASMFSVDETDPPSIHIYIELFSTLVPIPLVLLTRDFSETSPNPLVLLTRGFFETTEIDTLSIATR